MKIKVNKACARFLLCGFVFTLVLHTTAGAPAKADGETFYVATDGADSNPGTKEQPFATLAKARDAVREIKKQKREGDITVFIRGGIYTIHETIVFGLEDSGSQNQKITYSVRQH